MADLKRAPSDSPLRPTGIPPVRELPWGAHVCMFYEAPQDLIDALAAYFGAGLEEGEFCVWALAEPVDRDEAIAGMRAAIPEFDHYLETGAIELIPGYDWYLGGDEFDPQRITGGWHEKRRQAEARGYAGMRVSGNAFWMEASGPPSANMRRSSKSRWPARGCSCSAPIPCTPRAPSTSSTSRVRTTFR
jgi:hypothetical protein